MPTDNAAYLIFISFFGIVYALVPFAILGTYFQVQKLLKEQKQTNKNLLKLTKLVAADEE